MFAPRHLGVAAVLLLAACTSATQQASSTGAGGPLAGRVDQLSQPVTSYAMPTEPISGVDAVRGRTVYYVPITQQAPQFQVTQKALAAALGKAGVKLQVCNGNATPTDISACVSQATGARAGAIITDAIPYALGANALDAAIAAGIPVLNTNQLPDPDHPAAARHGYIGAAGSEQMVAVTDWIINDSGGKAQVVINQSTDSPSAVAYVTAAKDEFASRCPGCTVVVNPISSANFSLIPSSTSSALLKNPDVTYVVTEFDQYLQPTQAGVQQSGRAASVKGASGAAQLAGLQMMKNKNFLYASVGQAPAYQGWADADAALRMMTGTSGADLPVHKIPIRLFTRDNIDSIALTDAAQASGEWFGPTDFPAAYQKLWGLG